jgi:lysozyme
VSIRGMLVFEEGYERKAYPDPVSRGAPWTIGIGHTGPEVKGNTVWTDEQIEAAYVEDEREAVQLCYTHFGMWFDKLNDARQAVLVGMMFQMGPSRLLKFTNTLAAMREGRYVDAANGMRASLWARQTPKRVIRVSEQMETGVWNPHYLGDMAWH